MNCPACNQPLRHGVKMNKGQTVHVLRCTFPPCPSKIANDGMEGASAEVVLKMLADKVQAELEDLTE